MKKNKKQPGFFENLATKATIATGSTTAIIVSFSIIIIWAISGPLFNYSEIWQLIINTGTTIITFLMVFLIQKSQNKDSAAVHLKLNELLAASDLSSNRLVDVEDLTEEELGALKKYYARLKEKAKKESSLIESHSIDGNKHFPQKKDNPPGSAKRKPGMVKKKSLKRI